MTTKVTRKRYTKVRARKPRYNFFRKMRGKSERIAIMGARPAITYACSVVGISDTQLKANRAMLASMAFGDMPGSSINLKYILAENRELDPLFVYVVAPIFKWACMVWDKVLPLVDLQIILAQAKLNFSNFRIDAMAGKGPAHAYVKALSRIGWEPTAANKVITDSEGEIDLTVTCPRTIEVLAKRSVVRLQWNLLAKSHEWPDFEEGGFAEGIRALLHDKTSALNSTEKSQLLAAASLRLWTPERLEENGYATPSRGFCPSGCGGRGTLRHLVWRCPVGEDTRRQMSFGTIGQMAAQSEEEHLLFTHALLPPLFAQRPHRQTAVEWHRASRSGRLSGTIYIDGSTYNGGAPQLAPQAVLACAGAAAVKVNGMGEIEEAVGSTTDCALQEPGSAEIEAAALALNNGDGPIDLVGDCKGAVNGYHQGEEWCCNSKRKYADSWRKLWCAKRDYPWPVSWSWTKAHTTMAMVDRGEANFIDHKGNAAADEWAKRIAAINKASVGEVRRLERTLHVQKVVGKWIAKALSLASNAQISLVTPKNRAVRPVRRQVELLPEPTVANLCVECDASAINSAEGAAELSATSAGGVGFEPLAAPACSVVTCCAAVCGAGACSAAVRSASGVAAACSDASACSAAVPAAAPPDIIINDNKFMTMLPGPRWSFRGESAAPACSAAARSAADHGAVAWGAADRSASGVAAALSAASACSAAVPAAAISDASACSAVDCSAADRSASANSAADCSASGVAAVSSVASACSAATAGSCCYIVEAPACYAAEVHSLWLDDPANAVATNCGDEEEPPECEVAHIAFPSESECLRTGAQCNNTNDNQHEATVDHNNNSSTCTNNSINSSSTCNKHNYAQGPEYSSNSNRNSEGGEGNEQVTEIAFVKRRLTYKQPEAYGPTRSRPNGAQGSPGRLYPGSGVVCHERFGSLVDSNINDRAIGSDPLGGGDGGFGDSGFEQQQKQQRRLNHTQGIEGFASLLPAPCSQTSAGSASRRSVEVNGHCIEPMADGSMLCVRCYRRVSNEWPISRPCGLVDWRLSKVHGSHVLWRVGPWLVCFKCGHSSRSRVVGLGKCCKGGLAVGDARHRINSHVASWSAGKHPVSGFYAGDPVRV